MSKGNALKSEMLAAIRKSGAWFTTRNDTFIKIGYSPEDNCYFARECIFRDGTMTGGAYTFGTDWFDISFHGKYIDIYVDPETFRRWDIVYDPENGTCGAGESGRQARMLGFCRQADQEALAGGLDAYQIHSANFSKIIEL